MTTSIRIFGLALGIGLSLSSAAIAHTAWFVPEANTGGPGELVYRILFGGHEAKLEG